MLGPGADGNDSSRLGNGQPGKNVKMLNPQDNKGSIHAF